MNTIDLTGKVALVTGGSRGLGKAIAMAMAEKGAEVIICGRKQNNLDQAVEDLRQKGMNITAFVANVGRSDEVTAMFKAIEDRFDRLDILVNNVGMNILTPSVIATDEGLWDKIITTNLKGTFFGLCRWGEIDEKGRTRQNHQHQLHCRAKGCNGYGDILRGKGRCRNAHQGLGRGTGTGSYKCQRCGPIRGENTIQPAFLEQRITAKGITNTIPMGRIAETEDVVGTVLFLASGMSDFVTGEIITVDGGSVA